MPLDPDADAALIFPGRGNLCGLKIGDGICTMQDLEKLPAVLAVHLILKTDNQIKVLKRDRRFQY